MTGTLDTQYESSQKAHEKTPASREAHAYTPSRSFETSLGCTSLSQKKHAEDHKSLRVNAVQILPMVHKDFPKSTENVLNILIAMK